MVEGFGLSLVEAIKCGNFIISSINGGIADVVEGYDRVRFIKDANIISAWIKEFGDVISSDSWRNFKENHRDFLIDFFSLESWEDRIRNGLK